MFKPQHRVRSQQFKINFVKTTGKNKQKSLKYNCLNLYSFEICKDCNNAVYKK
jgi:hypothetical protein